VREDWREGLPWRRFATSFNKSFCRGAADVDRTAVAAFSTEGGGTEGNAGDSDSIEPRMSQTREKEGKEGDDDDRPSKVDEKKATVDESKAGREAAGPEPSLGYPMEKRASSTTPPRMLRKTRSSPVSVGPREL
jgi:hypothetical protein